MRFLLIALCAGQSLFSSSQVYTLIEKIRDERSQTVWTITEADTEVRFEGSTHENKSVSVGNLDYFFSFYSFSSPTHSYEIDMAGNILTVKGATENGDRKRKSYNLGKEPWVQQLWFGLRPFLASSRHEFRFSIINPKDFDRVRMVATKESIEPIVLGSNEFMAQKVKISLQGFKSMFWSGYVWYNRADHTFLKYEATKGPNTPLTIIERISLDPTK